MIAKKLMDALIRLGGVTRGISSRTVSTDGTVATEQTWQYGLSANPNIPGFAITDPLGNVQTSDFTSSCTSEATGITFQDSGGLILKQTSTPETEPPAAARIMAMFLESPIIVIPLGHKRSLTMH